MPNTYTYSLMTNIKMKTAVSSRLEDLMKANDVSELEIAKRSGLNQPTVHRILSGESKNPRLDNLAKIAKVFNVSVAYLTNEETNTGNLSSPIEELSPAAAKLVNQVNKLAKNNLKEGDYLILSHLLTRFSKDTD
jgi:transcriptional regulator with XRE-family HTH domain